jgi:SAM-dependent methyltransferase
LDWIAGFYQKQSEWGLSSSAVRPFHRARAARMEDALGSGPFRVLELGAGAGEVAIAMAERGHDVVAVDLVGERIAAGEGLIPADMPGRVTLHQGDFYTIDIGGPFDVVCYWDGFGVGTDPDQRRLLGRIADWIGAQGHALIDIYTPWYAAASAGHGHTFESAAREYGFDAAGCRWLDSWWARDAPEDRVTQSLRCYSPADLRLLLEGTGLVLIDTIAGGGTDWSDGSWADERPLGIAMSYQAHLRSESAPSVG